MKPILEQLADYRANLEKLDAFAARYPEVHGWPSCYSPTLSIELRYADDATRNRTLAKVGETLGRSGWMKKPDSSHLGYFTFFREIDGVKVIIEGAEQFISQDGEIPVPPSAFPILLEDAAE